MNEEYISNQIAVYKNSKTLVEFQDKLKVASMQTENPMIMVLKSTH